MYVGRTSNLTGRLSAHNHASNKGYTKRYQPWVLIYWEEYDSINEAIKREKYFKTGVGRDFLKAYITGNK
jgi:putative endonuclease